MSLSAPRQVYYQFVLACGQSGQEAISCSLHA